MNHHLDFEELLSALSQERVELSIAGAYAVMAVAEPRCMGERRSKRR